MDFEGIFVPDELLNAWLAALDGRGDEYDRRKAHGHKVLRGQTKPFVLHPKVPE